MLILRLFFTVSKESFRAVRRILCVCTSLCMLEAKLHLLRSVKGCYVQTQDMMPAAGRLDDVVFESPLQLRSFCVKY